MINVPEGVTVSVNGNDVTVKGPNGEVSKSFSKLVSIKVDGQAVAVTARKNALVNTVESIISSMAKGVTEGYKREMKLLYSHFPISVEVKGNEIAIKNFLGEKYPRKTYVAGNCKVEIKGQNVTVSGSDKQAVGQTIANMKSAMKIKEKDGRIFQDGIYEV